MTNCPNCGAPVGSYKCDYCGTVFEESEHVTLSVETRKLIDAIHVERLYKDAIKAMRGYAGHI